MMGLVAAVPWGYSQTEPAMHVLDFNQIPYETLNRNTGLEEAQNNRLTGVSYFGQGYQIRSGEGRHGSQAAYCAIDSGDKSMGLTWSFNLSQTHPEPVRITGWSRAQDVTGSPNSDYSLYIDVIYQDGTPSWGHNAPFSPGTHDWQEKTVLIIPEKPIRSISCYALFRHRLGQVWFDDIVIQKSSLLTNMMRLDGISVRPGTASAPFGNPKAFNTGDMNAKIDPSNGAISALSIHQKELPLTGIASGFLVRDVSRNSDYYPFPGGQCAPVDCRLVLSIEANEHALHIRGELTDLSGQPRALNLLYAIPIDSVGRTWGDYAGNSRSIAEPEDYHSWIEIGVGSNGQISRYPFACISGDGFGLSLALDMGKPCQWRLGYSSQARILYISADLGLHPAVKANPSKASFEYILYSIDPAWGFRSAAERYYQIFPDYFAVRSREQGIWMPFTDVSTVEGWEDFGFKYHEGNNNVAFDDSANILSFRYSEPSTWWMNMNRDVPRTYEAAMAQVQALADSSSNASQQKRAKSLLASGSFDAERRYQMQFRNEPWSNGAVFSLNPSPYLPDEFTNASLMWNPTLAEQLYSPSAKAILDGEYLDSLEGYVTADLNFRDDHFPFVTTPLNFTLDTRQLVIYKAFSIYEFTRYMSEEMHSRGKLLFANSVPHRYAFLCPWLDVMGTETNWIQSGKFVPDSNETLYYRRTLCGPKPYLFLMNTDFNQMSYALVEKYFQRCLFFGMYPSMFSHNAADDPYWQNPTLYNRDRPLFKKYQPLIRLAAEAGWEPVTYVRAEEEAILIERFGPSGGNVVYLTVLNKSNRSVPLVLSACGPLEKKGLWIEKLTGKEGEWNRGLESTIEADAVQIYQISLQNETSSIQGSRFD